MQSEIWCSLITSSSVNLICFRCLTLPNPSASHCQHRAQLVHLYPVQNHSTEQSPKHLKFPWVPWSFSNWTTWMKLWAAQKYSGKVRNNKECTELPNSLLANNSTPTENHISVTIWLPTTLEDKSLSQQDSYTKTFLHKNIFILTIPHWFDCLYHAVCSLTGVYSFTKNVMRTAVTPHICPEENQFFNCQWFGKILSSWRDFLFFWPVITLLISKEHISLTLVINQVIIIT